MDNHRANFLWRPLGGWAGRSPPERAKYKLPIVRQDVKRWCRRMGIPFNHLILSTTAQEKDIGDPEILLGVGDSIGLDPEELASAIEDPDKLTQLEKNHAEAKERGAFGVPTFIVGDQVFWGLDGGLGFRR